MKFNDLNSRQQRHLINEICTIHNISFSMFDVILNRTESVSGVQFASIKGYSSSSSNYTEIANIQLNLGASYGNMLSKDNMTFNEVNLEDVVVDEKDLNNINLNGILPIDFIQAVKNQLSTALVELQNPKVRNVNSSDFVDNEITFNKVLSYNVKTQKLGIFAQQVKKTTIQNGEYKIVKSSPKTIAKNVIKKYVSSRCNTIRKFTLDTADSLTIGGVTIKFN